ncbi:MAG TPA: DNA primase [Firmicutes bacterium]|nr:DNA primase [Candidatus Fermentithermobacillaceae bacterium]
MSDIIDFLNLLKNVKSNGQNGWTALCPAHDDTENSLAVSSGDDGRILINCFAGCSASDIVAAVGWKLGDLFVSSDRRFAVSGSGPQGPGPARAITIADLAADKGIPLDFLSYYCEQLPFGVKIVYKNLDGKPAARQRLRIALSAKEGSRWTRGAGSPVLYGIWRVSRMSQESDALLLVEGESDAWTAWLHKIAALGIPGADMAGKILKSYVDPFAKIYIWQEPDDGGKTFVKGVAERLAGLGYGGEVFIVQGPPENNHNNQPIKDLNQLHKIILKEASGSLEQTKTIFKDRWQQIVSAAQPVDLSKIIPKIKPLVPGVYFPGSGAAAPDPNYLSPDSASLEVTTYRNLTDMGNADRLIALHGDEILFCYPWNTWLVWNGKRWQRDETGEIDRKAEATVRSIYAEAANEPDRERRFEIVKHAKQSESAAKIKAMIDRAKNRRPAVPDQFDRDTFLLNCQNGTIDLRTGELREHNKNDLITKISPAKYDLSSGEFDLEKEAPLWDKFLRRVTNDDPELMSFLQRAAGYALTGDTSEHCLFFLHGDGRNGKSVFLNTLEYVLGDYGSVARPDVLMAKKYGDGIPNEIAALVGVRFVSTTETGSGKRFAEAMLKQYTGGDTISARFLHAEFFTFKPQFKIFLASNHKPVIRGQDVAIWERIYLIPFTAYIPPEERDKKLGEKLQKEADGILRWAVEGCLMWQRDGLNPPDIVRAATEEYKREMDVLGEFIEDRCYLSATARATSADLWKEYLDWCESNGEKYPINRREFKAELERRGIEHKRNRNYRYFLGIGLLSKGREEQETINVENEFFNDDLNEKNEKNSFSKHPENGDFSEEAFNGGENAMFDEDDPY